MYNFISDCTRCEICQQSFKIQSQLIQHRIKCNQKNKLKISTLIKEFNFFETVYSSDSDCDYEITTIVKRIPRKTPERIQSIETIENPDFDPILIEYLEEGEEIDEDEKIIKEKEIPESPSTCKVCQKSFTNKKNLKIHMNSHELINSEKNKFICSICGKGFKLARYLKSHEKIHTGIKAYKCEICNVCFIHQHTLKSHQRVHTGEKPYECKTEGCGKAFSFYSGLKQHILVVHTVDSKKYVCDFCGKSFPTKGRYNEHVRTHTGEKPLICKVCNKGFNSYGILNVHKRTHTGERPFKCKICGKSFIKNHGLTQHNKSKKRCFPPEWGEKESEKLSKDDDDDSEMEEEEEEEEDEKNEVVAA